MPSIQREFTVEAPPKTTWNHLTDMETFSTHVPGYRSFERVDDDTSLWTVQVDLLRFSREVTFEVSVTRDEFPRGEFDFTPLKESVSASGTVELQPDGEEATTVMFTIESEASGRKAPILNQVIKRALPHIADGVVDSVTDTDISPSSTDSA